MQRQNQKINFVEIAGNTLNITTYQQALILIQFSGSYFLFFNFQRTHWVNKIKQLYHERETSGWKIVLDFSHFIYLRNQIISIGYIFIHTKITRHSNCINY